MWLDLAPRDYHGQPDPLVLGAECAHESDPIPGWWLREQIEAGVTKRVIDAATRAEMAVSPRGE